MTATSISGARMGGAVMMGLGLALAQPDVPVVVITGDGEMLMGIGSLATVGMQKPGNLSIVVLDNERLWRDRRADQPHRLPPPISSASRKPAASPTAGRITTMAEVEALVPKLHDLKSGPRFANVKIDGANIERILPMRDGTFIVNRIRGSLGFPPL